MSAAEKVTHTPGPWIVSIGHRFPNEYSLWDASENIPANIDAEAEGNARLIAAAPDLMEALEVMLDVAPFAADPLTQVIHAKAEAAIRKAKGE